MATITSTIKLVDQMTPTLNKISKAIDNVKKKSESVVKAEKSAQSQIIADRRLKYQMIKRLEQAELAEAREKARARGQAEKQAQAEIIADRRLKAQMAKRLEQEERRVAQETAREEARAAREALAAEKRADIEALASARQKAAEEKRLAMQQAQLAAQGKNILLGLGNTGKSVANGMLSAFRRVAMLLGTIISARAFINMADSLMNVTARIDSINDGLYTTSQYMDMIYMSAQRSRSDFATMANSVAKLYTLAGHAFGSMSEAVGFTELMNKLFVISGSSAAEASNAMYQLTQAMASGKLQGDEMRSILENAPMLAQKIAEKLGVAIGEVKNLGAEGKITADLIKEVMFDSADEIEKRFEKMPKTLGQIWTEIKNSAVNSFRPVVDKFQKIINGAKFTKLKNQLLDFIGVVADGVLRLISAFNSIKVQNAIAKICESLSYLWGVVKSVADMMIQAAIWISENWNWIAPIIYGVVAAFLVLKTILFILSVAETIAAVAAFLLGTAIGQIILIIMAVVLAIYLAVAAWNYFTGQTVSATGIIFGAVAFVIACVIDLFVFLWDCFMSLIHILIALGKTIWQVCVDIFQFIIALATNIVLFITMLIVSALYLIFSVGSNIVDTLAWVIDVFKVWGSNILIGMQQLCENLPLYWELFKLNVIAKFWQMVVALGLAFNSMSQSARDGVVNMLKPFEGLVNGFLNLLETLKDKWNDFVGGLSIGAFGYELWSGDSLKINKSFTGTWSAEGWVKAAPTINVGNAVQKAAQAHAAANSILGSMSEVNWSTNDLPEYTVDWGKIRSELGDLWSSVEWADMGTFDGDKYSDIWGDLKGSLGDTWDSSQYANPLEWFNNAYKTGEAVGNTIAGLVEGIGGLLEKMQITSDTGFKDWDKEAYNGTGYNIADSLEDLLGGTGDIGDNLGAIADNTGNSANSASNIEDTLDLAEEELEFLRKLAEQEVINRFTTAEIHVDMTNNNNISSKMDLDGIVTHLSNKLYEELGVVASGVHY